MSTPRWPAEHEPYQGGFPEEMAHVVRCVADRMPPRADGIAGREAVRVCLAIQEAIRTGQPVSLA